MFLIHKEDGTGFIEPKKNYNVQEYKKKFMVNFNHKNVWYLFYCKQKKIKIKGGCV